MITFVNKLRCQCLLMKNNLRKKSHSRVRGHLKQLKTRTEKANSRDMMQIKAYWRLTIASLGNRFTIRTRQQISQVLWTILLMLVNCIPVRISCRTSVASLTSERRTNAWSATRWCPTSMASLAISTLISHQWWPQNRRKSWHNRSSQRRRKLLKTSRHRPMLKKTCLRWLQIWLVSIHPIAQLTWMIAFCRSDHRMRSRRRETLSNEPPTSSTRRG